MCKKSGCYNTGLPKYGGYCRAHAPPIQVTTVVPSKGTTSRLEHKGEPRDEKGIRITKTVSGSGGELLVEPRRRFIHRWGCEYLILCADGRIPVGKLMPAFMTSLVEAMPVATHAGRLGTAPVGGALETLVDDLERFGLILFPVPRTLYELLLIATRWTLSDLTVTFPGFTVEDAFDLDAGKATSTQIAPVSCDRCRIRAWTSKRHKEKPKEPAGYYSELRKAPEHLAFRLHANALVAALLQAVDGRRVTEGAIIHRCLAATTQALERAGKRMGSGTWTEAYRTLAGQGARKDLPAMILSTMLVELGPCPDGEPGFLVYRGTGPHSESSSLEGGYDLSYGMSLFGGWFFDGPTNGTASACAVQYLMTANGTNRNYWIVKIKWSEYLATIGPPSIPQDLLLPAIPVSIQLFGFEGGFHARLWMRTDGRQTSYLQKFMKGHHLSYFLDPMAGCSIALGALALLPSEPSSVDLTTLAASELVDGIELLDDAARRDGWVRHPVPGGGDCLYHSVLTHFALDELGVERGTHASDVAALRDALARFIDETPGALTGLGISRIDTTGLRQRRNDFHEGADAMPYVIQRFLGARGLHYNLRIYSFASQLRVIDLGQTTDPELPIAQWQNFQGGHFDPMLPVLEPAI